jgi:hypothetical protein
MAYFDSGIQDYIVAEATIRTAFPISSKGVPFIACRFCDAFNTVTKRCILTQEVVPFPDNYTGNQCPLKPITQKEYENYVQG